MIRHLVHGLTLLGERWTAGLKKWLAAGENWLDTGVRLLMLGAAGAVLAFVLLGSLLRVGLTAAVIVVLALRAATKDATGEPEKAVAEPAATPAEGGLPEVSPQEFLELLYDVLGTARGVHLATLANALTHRVGGAWEAADVRALCEASGVPVRPTVRAPGRGPTVGVHRGDLKPLPRPLPEGVKLGAETDYTAGQPAELQLTTTAPTTPTTPTRRRVGDQLIVATDDPDNPARTHVQVIDIGRKKRA